MKNKMVELIVEMITYYFLALLILFIFKTFVGTKDNIYLSAFAITIGWMIGKILIDWFKNKSNK